MTVLPKVVAVAFAAIVTVGMLAVTTSCSSRSAPSQTMVANQQAEEAAPSTPALPPSEAPRDDAKSGSALGLGAPMPASPSASRAAPKGGGGGDKAPKAAAGKPRPARLVHYNGSLRLRAPDPATALTKAAKLADEAGGYIESLSEAAIVVRVPVARFRDVFRTLAGLGTVLTRSMTAQDVTDAFVATDLRLKILRASRDRLLALLARASSALTKLELLSGIQRLTEEIDQLARTLQELASLAEFSRINVDMVTPRPELNQPHEEPIAAFVWLPTLSPFVRTVADSGDRLAFAAPKGMVEVKDRHSWTVESADGAVVWASRRKNTPVGTTEFWLEALRSRLAPDYAVVKPMELGPYKALRFVDGHEGGAYRYLVGVRVKGDTIELVEAYFATEAQEQRYLDAVNVAIAGGAS